MNFALKYRPKSFSEIVGQRILVRILENAFSLDRVPQAVLLVGSSGVGKTTTARVIALCLTCKSAPTSTPCGVCESCIAVISAYHPDVIEFDAASNTGVDDIRIILENVKYLPIESKFKVYIIDEVHMLSNSAFNALLKTLEEPLPNVKFILATTELRKVPITVLSRCHRFDLLKISEEDICQRLKLVAEKELINYDDEALQLIANKSGGSMRDAMFLLERAFSYSKGLKIDVNSIYSLLGCVDRSILYSLLECIIVSDSVQALTKFEKACQSSNPVIILEEILEIVYEICRFLLIPNNSSYISTLISKVSNKRVCNISFLSRLWQALLKGINEVRSAPCIYSASEMLVIRLSYLSDLPSPSEVIKKIGFSGLNKVPIFKEGIERNEGGVKNSKESIFKGIVNILRDKGRELLYTSLLNDVSLIDCGNGFLMLRENNSLPNRFSDDLTEVLNVSTGRRWFVTVHKLSNKDEYANVNIDEEVDSIAKVIIEEFEGAKIVDM